MEKVDSRVPRAAHRCSASKSSSGKKGRKAGDERDEETLYARLVQWLGGHDTKRDASVSAFLKQVDEFDLGEYIRAIRFDELRVPTAPFQLPLSRTYYGLEEMRTGELDFLKATVLGRSREPVFLCSDMPMDDLAADEDFKKKYLFGLAMVLKKGLHLNVVHNLDRPFSELMLGLQGWVPMYMTGQISPYYLKGVQNNVYCHFLNVSGSAALSPTYDTTYGNASTSHPQADL